MMPINNLSNKRPPSPSDSQRSHADTPSRRRKVCHLRVHSPINTQNSFPVPNNVRSSKTHDHDTPATFANEFTEVSETSLPPTCSMPQSIKTYFIACVLRSVFLNKQVLPHPHPSQPNQAHSFIPSALKSAFPVETLGTLKPALEVKPNDNVLIVYGLAEPEPHLYDEVTSREIDIALIKSCFSYNLPPTMKVILKGAYRCGSSVNTPRPRPLKVVLQ